MNAETRPSALESLLATREIVVFCGSGGVGKTTTAAAAALAAARLGGKVLVLTIDPARRLADALGIEGFGNVERRVPDELLRNAGLEPRGEMYAAMLDTKRSGTTSCCGTRPTRRRPTGSWRTGCTTT